MPPRPEGRYGRRKKALNYRNFLQLSTHFEKRLRLKCFELPIVEAHTLHGYILLLCKRARWIAVAIDCWIAKLSTFQTCCIRVEYILNAYRERVGGRVVKVLFFIHESQIELGAPIWVP